MPADTDEPIRGWQLAVALVLLVVMSPLLVLDWLWRRLRGRQRGRAPAEVRRLGRASRPARPVWWRRWGRSLARGPVRLLEGSLGLLWLLLYEVDDSNRFSSTYRFRFGRRNSARGLGRPRRRALGWLGLVAFVIAFAGAVALLAYAISKRST